MNLIDSPWLPFRAQDGSIAYRPPSAIADPEVIDLALPRADFQGAAWQWLIGLLQTALPPEDIVTWAERFDEPPNASGLDAAFAPFKPAFEFDGDGARFMQDLDPLEEAKPSPVASLLIEAPGGNTLKLNIDHFTKRGIAEAICLDCAAIALFTMQVNAPGGGVGYRVGLRGGGPLTTLVLPDDPEASLWHKLWLNVVTSDALELSENGKPDTAPDAYDPDLFPWVGATRESKKPNTQVLPGDVHPLHPYWAMPRRFRLQIEDKPCECQLCGRESPRRVRELRAKNYGTNYDGPWQHPLTPYRRNPKKLQELPLSIKGQPGGLGYRHWASLVLPDEEGSGALPALVVNHYVTVKYPQIKMDRAAGETGLALARRARLWVFGFDLDNMKARGWFATEMPLVNVPEVQQERLRDWAKLFSELARDTTWNLRTQLKGAWFKRPSEAKGDMSSTDAQFYSATEADFYRALTALAEVLKRGDEQIPSEVARDWYRSLRARALALFDANALSGPIEQLDMKRLIRARQQLLGWLLGTSKGSKAVKDFAKLGGFELQPERNDELNMESIS